MKMGIGRYKDGKFDLILSIRHNADATRIQQWERSFRRASEILFDATDGQMQFGKLFVANNSIGNNEADAWLLEEAGTSSASVNALGISGLHMNLKSDEKNKPFIIIHEFGHYGFGLYDEYIGPGEPNAECTGDPGTGACIMEHGYWNGDQIDDAGNLTEGAVNEFCVDDNHDPDNDTYQESIHGEPCWETIQDYYPDVDVPDGLPDAPIPDGHENVEWILLAEDPRFALILDKSGSMSAGNAIAGVRYGADYWVNFLAQTGDSLSIIAYNHTQDVILPLTPLSSGMSLGSILSSIAGITPGGTTNIGGAMQKGANEILSPGDRAATQVMILFTDGLHNTGTPPEDVLDHLVENGIRVYTIGFGPYADDIRLQEIAEATGGTFTDIDDDPTTPTAQLDIQNCLIEISGEVRDGSGIITMAPGLLPEPEEENVPLATKVAALGYLPGDLKFIEKMSLAFRKRCTGFDHKAFVERGSARATFVASYQEGTSVNFYLIRPDGKVVDPDKDPDVTFVNPENVPYAFYTVDKPQRGYWVMRVTRGQKTGEIPFKVFAFSEYRDIAIGISGVNQVYNVEDIVKLRAQVYHRVPLTNIKDPVVRVLSRDYIKKPGFKPQSVTLRERLITHDAKGKSLKKPYRLRNGVYEGELIFGKPGSYLMEVKFINRCQSKEATPEAERPRKSDKEGKVKPAPVFVRKKYFQIHVGPLSEGKDVEQVF